jgi:hypothetical protein
MAVSANSFGLAFFAWDRERSVASDQRGGLVLPEPNRPE